MIGRFVGKGPSLEWVEKKVRSSWNLTRPCLISLRERVYFHLQIILPRREGPVARPKPPVHWQEKAYAGSLQQMPFLKQCWGWSEFIIGSLPQNHCSLCSSYPFKSSSKSRLGYFLSQSKLATLIFHSDRAPLSMYNSKANHRNTVAFTISKILTGQNIGQVQLISSSSITPSTSLSFLDQQAWEILFSKDKVQASKPIEMTLAIL